MKAVFFDFDGTLTEKHGNLWRKIWEYLGYETGEGSYYRSLLNSFLDNKLTHQKWCELTLKAYNEKGFNIDILNKLVSQMKLMKGLENLFKTLYKNNVEIHIVSGNIISVIRNVLGDKLKYVTNVVANEFVFDNKGLLVDIIGTKYDCEGKAKYIEEVCKKKGFKKDEVVFVGNSLNDEWVYKAKVKTICINPDETKSEDSEIWNKVIYTDDLNDLLNEILKMDFKTNIQMAGIRNKEDALMCVKQGVNIIGLLVGQAHSSDDFISKEKAKEIKESLPNNIKTTLITHLEKAEEIIELVEFINVDYIQLHSHLEEIEVEKIRKRFPDKKLIRLIHISKDGEILNDISKIKYVDFYFTDSINIKTNQVGGTGLVHNYDTDKKLVETLDKPVFIAGGLTPENVGDVVRYCKPYGVDVNSGCRAKNGLRDEEKVIKFIKNANK